MDRLYRFGPVTVAFRNMPRSGMWPFWEWKPDAYRIADGQAELTVDWEDRPVYPTGTPVFTDTSPMVRREYYRMPDGGILWQQVERCSGNLQLQYVMSPDARRITLTRDDTGTVGMAAFESLTFLLFYALLRHGVLALHGALVERDGKGFLLCAPSGTGKTTHARLWRDCRNALILNGDRGTCFRRGEQWTGFGMPWCGTGGEYINRSVPLQAVVILRRGTENRAGRVDRQSLLQEVLPHVVCPGWDRTGIEAALSLLDGLLTDVPVLWLECTPDEASVDVLEQALEAFA